MNQSDRCLPFRRGRSSQSAICKPPDLTERSHSVYNSPTAKSTWLARRKRNTVHGLQAWVRGLSLTVGVRKKATCCIPSAVK